jgi:hypothetical protein
MLSHAEAMLAAHPRTIEINMSVLVACLAACHDCAQSCTSCADACLGEKEPQNLVRCIRLNLDCADICAVTARLLARHTESHSPLLRRQLEVCREACQACADECQKHAHHHQHCQVCAEACHQCAEACQALLLEVPTTEPLTR